MINTNFQLATCDGLAPVTAQLFAAATPAADLWIWFATAVMFALVSLVIFHSLRHAKFVEGGGRAIVSILIAILAVIGLLSGPGGRTGYLTVRGPQSDVTTSINVTLDLYAALAIALLCLFILVAMVKAHAWLRARFGAFRASHKKRSSEIRTCPRTCVRNEFHDRHNKKLNPIQKEAQGDDAD